MTEHLSDQQIARLEALQASAAVLGRGALRPPETQDLVDLAEYIINSTHPMDRFNKEETR